MLGTYLHGTRIGALVALEGGDAELARDLAMHVAASNPRYLSAADVPADDVAKERDIRVEMLKNDEKNKGKPEAILVKIVEGGLDKWLDEITLLGQPFVKDDKRLDREAAEGRQCKHHALRAPRGRRRHREEAGRLRRRSAWRRPKAAEAQTRTTGTN